MPHSEPFTPRKGGRTLPRAIRLACLLLTLCACAAWGAPRGGWKQVHPHWQDAFIISFRSPDLLTNDPDERWGYRDGRLMNGQILGQFPIWLRDQSENIRQARRDDRPIILSLHVHSGYGTGLVTYSSDLQTAEVVNYPWLIRELEAVDLHRSDVTVVVDTCNAQATAAHQLRPDLIPAGPEAWAPMKRWRAAHPARRSLPLDEAYELFSRDRVAGHLGRPALGRRQNVVSVPYEPLSRDERRQFRAAMYGQKGVIFATPALFNLLRLGPNPRGTLTANLLKDRLSGAVIDSLLSQNKAEFFRFKEFAFLSAAGVESSPVVQRYEVEERRATRRSREDRIERD
jgi:hypothetical protein